MDLIGLASDHTFGSELFVHTNPATAHSKRGQAMQTVSGLSEAMTCPSPLVYGGKSIKELVVSESEKQGKQL
jgi:hypothetical protein